MIKFSLFKRKGKPGYYVQYWDEEEGRYRNALSINRIAKKMGEREPVGPRNKPMAYAIATKAALSGFDRPVAGERQMLDEYVEKFWNFDDSAYIDRKNKAKKGSINRDYVEAMARLFRLHVKPLLRKNLRLDDLKVRDVQGIQDSLLKGGELSNKTINDCILSVAKPYHEALRIELVTSNPFERVLKLPLNTKERGIPTRTELEKTLEILQQRSSKSDTDMKSFIAVALALYTGMRQGEIKALHSSSIEFLGKENGDEAIITIDTAFAKRAGFKSTKGRKVRHSPAPGWLCRMLIDMGKKNPFGKDLIFWSTLNADKPFEARVLVDHFYAALNEAGISEEERIKRNITFHSLRHYFNSEMRDRVDGDMLRKVIGHESVAMTDHYTHETMESLLKVGKEARGIIDFSPEAK